MKPRKASCQRPLLIAPRHFIIYLVESTRTPNETTLNSVYRQ